MAERKQTGIAGEIKKDARELAAILWEEFPRFYNALYQRGSLEEVRKRILTYILALDTEIADPSRNVHHLEVNTASQCSRILYNVFKEENEQLSGHCALIYLNRMARGDKKVYEEIAPGFVAEFLYLLRGISGHSGIYDRNMTLFSSWTDGRKAAIERSRSLDELAETAQEYIARYTSGLDPDVIEQRKKRARIIAAGLGGSDDNWNDWRWQIGNVIKSAETLEKFVSISTEERQAIRLAVENGVPFGITPYYLSLMDEEPSERDRAVRAQVIPDLKYVTRIIEARHASPDDLDFMRERDTAPEDLITRRYPMIAILKPVNTCPQICVYCQRNWEINEAMAPEGMMPGNRLDKAIQWISQTKSLREVLITGGDPGIMSNRRLEEVMGRVAAIDHIQRIRIGTRTPVTVPQRINDGFADVLEKFYEPGRRDIVVVTHFEHLYEITPESVEAVNRIRKKGISVLNQLVFTYYNSRRFESVATKMALRLIGVEPYYTFNTQGKAETRRYLVPIARLLQANKEESRLVPGVVRTDRPVFNVPVMGKNYLHAWQNHEVIMIRPDGGRMINFIPWEKFIRLAETYVYKDVPIFEYLKYLDEEGEDINDYKNIWYYF